MVKICDQIASQVGKRAFILETVIFMNRWRRRKYISNTRHYTFVWLTKFPHHAMQKGFEVLQDHDKPSEWYIVELEVKMLVTVVHSGMFWCISIVQLPTIHIRATWLYIFFSYWRQKYLLPYSTQRQVPSIHRHIFFIK